jgi:hypothetical protein
MFFRIVYVVVQLLLHHSHIMMYMFLVITIVCNDTLIQFLMSD